MNVHKVSVLLRVAGILVAMLAHIAWALAEGHAR
jgi:hypothetical protein